MDEGREKRVNDRAAITLRVDYKRLNTFFADYTKNISKGGTFIKTSKPLDIGTEFVFVLSLPAKDQQLKLKGKVIWITTEAEAAQGKGEGQTPGMGIRFLFEDESERQALDDIVEQLMADALGSHISGKLLARKPTPGAD
ncbi:MAG TPA: TIGR02266 family protein [Polyangiaceae bacterium]|nr:TIGR02266 family protein [Polyangiaceae bacterium]